MPALVLRHLETDRAIISRLKQTLLDRLPVKVTAKVVVAVPQFEPADLKLLGPSVEVNASADTPPGVYELIRQICFDCGFKIVNRGTWKGWEQTHLVPRGCSPELVSFLETGLPTKMPWRVYNPPDTQWTVRDLKGEEQPYVEVHARDDSGCSVNAAASDAREIVRSIIGLLDVELWLPEWLEYLPRVTIG